MTLTGNIFLTIILICFTLVTSSNPSDAQTTFTESYVEAIKSYNQKKYGKAAEMFKTLIDKSDLKDKRVLQYHYAYTLYRLKDYHTAGLFFTEYYMNYPADKLAEETHYMAAYCAYINYSNSKVDYDTPYTVENMFANFTSYYPKSERVKQATQYRNEMHQVIKQYLSSSSRPLGPKTYLTALNKLNVLESLDQSSYRFEEMYASVIMAGYPLAKNSHLEEQEWRYNQVISLCQAFEKKFQKSRHLSDVMQVYKSCKEDVAARKRKFDELSMDSRLSSWLEADLNSVSIK